MCDICIDAAKELFTFAGELEKKYTGTTVTDEAGKVHPVAPGHHVFVAAQGLAEVTAAKELRFELETQAKERGISVDQLVAELRGAKSALPTKAGLFGVKLVKDEYRH